MAALVDTNILIYRHDPRFPEKQRVATAILRHGVANNLVRIAHQAVVEFMSAATRPLAGKPPLLSLDEARREAEELLQQFTVLYPNDTVVRTALRGAAAYQLSWHDAHMWAYAECHGLGELITEDFQHGRWYGTVHIRNPFLTEP